MGNTGIAQAIDARRDDARHGGRNAGVRQRPGQRPAFACTLRHPGLDQRIDHLFDIKRVAVGALLDEADQRLGR